MLSFGTYEYKKCYLAWSISATLKILRISMVWYYDTFFLPFRIWNAKWRLWSLWRPKYCTRDQQQSEWWKWPQQRQRWWWRTRWQYCKVQEKKTNIPKESQFNRFCSRWIQLWSYDHSWKSKKKVKGSIENKQDKKKIIVYNYHFNSGKYK